MAKSSKRLDKVLVERGLMASRDRAQGFILSGRVLVDGRRVTKSGQMVAPGCAIEVTGDDNPFVSRGGIKLDHALKTFALKVEGLTAMDVGASTGGFTDCLLQHGARKVYAVDVGYGQLAWSLRQDPRVVVLERQNIRTLPRELIDERVQVATMDTSFISLKLVIPAVMPFLDDQALLVALIKPQFEAGREAVGKGGVVKDSQVHQQVCQDIDALCGELGLQVLGITPSPLLGPKGNREFLLAARHHADLL